ncbi:serine/threonine-protein kinase LATS1-like isoform X1, partial [Clarias magur]
MRPKTFPASNNQQMMLHEIRESLRNISMSRPSDALKVDAQGQQGRAGNPKNHPYHRALQEIRESLLPFANEAVPAGHAPEVNLQMLQELLAAGYEEEMVILALKQTNSRSLMAAMDYISKMIYQDPGPRDQMGAAAGRTTNAAAKAAGPSHIQQPVLRRPSWKGSKESLAPQRHSGLYRSNSPSPQPDLPRPSTYPQGHAAGVGGQRVNPSPPSWDANPATKRYSGNMDYLATRISPIPQGPWAESYPNPSAQAQRGISPVPMGRQPIIMQGSGGNKFNYSPSWTQNGSAQVDYGHGMGRQPAPPPPYPLAQASGHSPTAQQLQAPNRNSHNMEMYVLGQTRPSAQQPPSNSGNGSNQDPPSWPHNMPARSNSFANAASGTRQCSPAASSQPSATTVTAITQAPVLQPVKSTRVPKPELHTAVAPTHPPRLQQQQQPPPMPSPYQESSVSAPPVSQIPVSEVPSYQGPPPPYPKHLVMSQQPPNPCSAYPKEDDGAEDDNADNTSTCSSERTDNPETFTSSTEREKKQITTSPVPVRKNKRDEALRGEGRVQLYSPQAFKFYMEQHVENILKNHQQRLRRKKQLESEMQRVGLSEDAQEQMRMMLSQKESNYIRLKRAKMEKAMFEKIKTLGVGAFGEVCLARKVDTGALYAMKTLRKKDVLLRNQVAHVKAERDILAEADNEWVVRLYYSFQDKENLYFVMDYIPGGDMMSLLIRLGVFSEELTRFYIAELTCAVESVHKMGFIHRDIKPDNILIDQDGHIKLTDFGLCTGFRWTHDSKYYQSGDHVRQDSMDFSKEWEDPSNCRCGDRLKPLERRAARQHQRCLAHSLVGTPNYIAPEVLLRTGYTQLCDWWSVGVILYEMLVGQPPFLATTPLETQMK